MKYTCNICGKVYDYCRACLLTPIPHKESGFCSIECYRVSKNNVVPTVDIEDVQPIEEETSVEAEAETIALTEVPIVETTVVEEPTFKNETNTYKKKKNKYKYTSSY